MPNIELESKMEPNQNIKKKKRSKQIQEENNVNNIQEQKKKKNSCRIKLCLLLCYNRKKE